MRRPIYTHADLTRIKDRLNVAETRRREEQKAFWFRVLLTMHTLFWVGVLTFIIVKENLL